MAGELKALVSEEFVSGLANEIHDVDQAFRTEQFIQSVLDVLWEERELKDRLQHVAHCIGLYMGDDYAHSIDVLKQIAVKYDGLRSLVFPEFVAQHGLDNWDTSMDALQFFTSLSSSELAVRPFIRLDQDKMMAQMEIWAKSGDHHIRRLASEGGRPRLPWASPLRRFIVNPEPVLSILEILRGDSEEYVRRSVANNLNDISKDHPDLALSVAQRWFGESENINWVVKHGLRTLLKKGNTDALVLFGYGSPDDLKVDNLHFVDGIPRIGASIYFEFDMHLDGEKEKNVRIEYAVYYLKANGKLSRKIFQCKESQFEPGFHTIKKKHSFEQRTTRKHYVGKHELAVVINGRELAHLVFELSGE